MARRYSPRVIPGKYINTKGHWMVDEYVWKILASNKKDYYEVMMKDRGFTCNCMALKRCKHISKVEQMISGPIDD